MRVTTFERVCTAHLRAQLLDREPGLCVLVEAAQDLHIGGFPRVHNFEDFRYRLATDARSSARVEKLIAFVTMYLDCSAYLNDDQQIVSIMEAVYRYLRTFQDGQNVYEIASGLARQLLDTELRGLATNDLQLPYPVITLLPPEKLLLFTHYDDDKACFVREFVISEDFDDTGIRTWRISVSFAPFAGASEPSPFVFVVNLSGDMSVDAAIARTARELDMQSVEYAAPELKAVDWQQLFRFVMNTVIYSTWSGAEIERIVGNKDFRQLQDRITKLPKGPKRDRLKDELRKLDPQNRIILGKHVIYVSRDQARAEDEAEAARTGKKLIYRVRVAGHWTNQPYGPNHSLRRRQWIKPYWRGPEDGVLRGAVHHLG